jgi:hypothetical protein
MRLRLMHTARRSGADGRNVVGRDDGRTFKDFPEVASPPNNSIGSWGRRHHCDRQNDRDEPTGLKLTAIA